MASSNSGKKIRFRSYDEVKATVVTAIMKLITRSKGTAVTFTAGKIASVEGLPLQPVTLTLVRDILENLCREGLIRKYGKTSHGIKYMITRESSLWLVTRDSRYAGRIKTPYLLTILPRIVGRKNK